MKKDLLSLSVREQLEAAVCERRVGGGGGMLGTNQCFCEYHLSLAVPAVLAVKNGTKKQKTNALGKAVVERHIKSLV